MFESLAEAETALHTFFDGPQLAVVLRTLAPALVFEPAPAPVLGGTRLGGTPDLPAGLDWPRPPAPGDPGAIASRGNADAEAEMLAHFARRLPYAFVAQIDLAEAAALPGAGADLPPNGRLLFFYDLPVGPWEPGTRPAWVIWDQAATDDLVCQPMPDDLAEAVTREHAELAALQARFGVAPSSHEGGSNYGAPARPMRLKRVVRLLHHAALEPDGSPEEMAFRDAYEAALATHDNVEEAPQTRHQVLGSPHPVQDDPRFDAVVVTEFGVPHLSSDQWREHQAAIRAGARAWRLLLQIDLADWMHAEFVEGTVYFLIRATDLAAQRFEAVVAIYQQT